jgi:NDP-sugar pyrophosphorylase family protein
MGRNSLTLSLVVLAAGIGSRFGGLKQIEPIGPGGEAILDYSVYDALRAGIERVVMIVSPANQDAISHHVKQGFRDHVEVAYALQEPPPGRKPWGTGQAVLTTRDVVPGPFGVVNGDDFYGRRSFQLMADDLRTDSPDHNLVAYPLRDMLSPFGGVSRGVCTVADDGVTLVSVTETHGIEESDMGGRFTGDEPISANLWGFRPSIYPELERDFAEFSAEVANQEKGEFYIGVTVARLVQDPAAPNVKVLRTPDRWLGVTYRDDVPAMQASLRALIESGEYPEMLWK